MAARSRPEAVSVTADGSTTSTSYFRQSRSPLASLVFVLPLVLAYEVGTWMFHLDARAQVETRIVAFTWIRSAFAHLGATGLLLPPTLVIGLLAGWHIFSRQPTRLRPTVPVAMVAESILMALPLFLMAMIFVRGGILGAWDGGDRLSQWSAMAVLGIGAGVYEELLFRLLGFLVLHAVLADLLHVPERWTLILSLLVTSGLFAGYHHVGGGEAFTWAGFGFRSAAGVWLGLTFVSRGFGIAAGTHAAYDVLLVTLAVFPAE